VAHATTSNPTFNRTLPHFVQHLLRNIDPASLRPGDVVCSNDPWLLCGHLPDIGIVTPFFKEDRLLGFTGSVAHLADIGGLFNAQLARTIFEEGLHLPPVKLREAGALNATVVDIIRRNVRAPEMVLGDINAVLTANAVAASQTGRLLEQYELESLEALSNAVQDRAERAMRNAIAAVPDGDYAYESTFDELDGPMTLGVELRVRGTELDVDFVRVPEEHPYGGVNCTLSYTTARSTYALNCILAPQIPNNEGLFRPIRVLAPEGSILNARYPASVNDRTKVGWHTEPVIYGALSKAVPELVPAPGGFKSLFRLFGVDETGTTFSSFMFNGGGMGAWRGGDGVGPICFPTSACNVPVEILETMTGIEVAEKEMLTDSAGAGRQRGGVGVRVTIHSADRSERPVTVTGILHHQGFPPFGLDGGLEGGRSRLELDGRPLAAEEVRREVGALVLSDSTTRLTLRTAGGGGFGDPLERDPREVLSDVRNGLVSSEAAARQYGVEVELDAMRAMRVRAHSEQVAHASGLAAE
jgi:N-methylhydantoinase B/oxoprolinase/acetone carboxylase alpha subunit